MDFQTENHTILCKVAGPLYARWIVDVPEPASWDDAFAEAFALRLAWACGRKIAGSDFDTEEVMKEYRMAIGAARGVDAKENPIIDPDESDWVLARYGAGRL